MTAMHIMSFAQNLHGGGVERAMLRLAGGWIAAGRRVTLVIGDPTGPLAAEVPGGAEIVALGSGAYRALLALPRLVAERRPDLLFCPGNHYTAIAAWTRARLRQDRPPIVAKMSNAVVRADQRRIAAAAQRLWLARHGRFLDALVAMTPASAVAAGEATRMVPTVIPNPPAVPIVGAMPVALPAGSVILGVGRLEPQKRWDRLIAALPLVAARDAVLVILGEGRLRGDLMAQAMRLGVGDRVHLPGYAADPLAAMARARVVALTSDYEGTPGVLREALSVGTPVVATASSPAVAEIVSIPEWGDVVALDDRAALVAALDRWLDRAAVRPMPVAPPGADAAMRYLTLFDALVSSRRPLPFPPSARPGVPARS